MELEPCPVCGATKGLYILEDYHEFEWYVFCDNCKTFLGNENAQTKEDAIKHWNTRHNRTSKRIVDEAYRHDDFECSECGWVVWGFLMEHEGEGVVSQPNYCPSCGAKVVEE